MTKTIVLITPRLQHYRLSFYKKLNININNQLIVFYGISGSEDGKAGYTGSTNFEISGFRELKIRLLPFDIVINHGMYNEFKRRRPEVLIILASTGNITYRRIINWAKKKNIKIIIWTSGWDPGRAKGLLLSFKNLLVSNFYRKADFFLTYSTNASDYVKARGIDDSKIEICYNGIETDDLIKKADEIIKKSKEIINHIGLIDHITFLYVGGLIPEKRVDILIDAFYRLRKIFNQIKLIIIGDGPLRGLVEEKLRNYKDPNILFLGRIIDNVDPYFVASDCFVLPGAGGLALNQAMFWKKTCIVSKADGTEDDLVIENITGYRFEENNTDSLINAMNKRITENPEKLKIMNENAHQLILNKSNVNNMVYIFSKIIDRLTIKKQN